MKVSALSSDQLVDFVKLSNGNSYLKPLSDIDRARLYPYRAPEGGYLLAYGALYNFDQKQIDNHSWIFDGRVPVLSVGSNRAPVQLLRKFGNMSIVPVTPARLFDFDIVHAAMLGYYAAVPCTAYPCDGCLVSLNVAWLNVEQLQHMHRTEGTGIAYDYVVMQNVYHDLVVPEQPVYGYVSRLGALDCGSGKPAALPDIAAVGRSFSTLSQKAVIALVRHLTDFDDRRSHAEFVTDIQRKKSARELIISRLRDFALFHKTPNWQVISVTVDGLDNYL